MIDAQSDTMAMADHARRANAMRIIDNFAWLREPLDAASTTAQFDRFVLSWVYVRIDDEWLLIAEQQPGLADYRVVRAQRDFTKEGMPFTTSQPHAADAMASALYPWLPPEDDSPS